MSVGNFNSYNYASKGYTVTGSVSSALTIEADTAYLVKSIRITNPTASAVLVDVKFYSGVDTTEFWVSSATSVAADATVNILVDSPLVLNGAAGDELRIGADTASAVDAVITYMELGRIKGF